jgi:IS5 family transposase
MKKPKLLRAPAALLRYFRAAPIAISAIVFSLLAPTPLIDKIHKEVFGDERGRPPHPLKSVYLANLIMRACNIRSENTLCDKISNSPASGKRLKFREQKLDRNKSPHNKVFTNFRERVGADNIVLIFRELVKIAQKMGLYDGTYLVLDSTVIDLCINCNCKHLKSCPYIQQNKKKFPKDCLIHSYENAAPGHKGGPDGDYRYVGYKKHDAIDLLSGLRIATIFTAGNASDNIIGLELLKIVKQFGFRPKYVLGDSGYDDCKIYNFIIFELKSKPVIKWNPRNTVAMSFTVETENGKIKTSPIGTPFCNANHKMKFVYVDDEKAAWACPTEQIDQSHMEDGKCLFNPDHDCIVYTCPGDEPRRFSLPPRETDEWHSIYKLRKEGEQTFSQYKENLNLGVINYRTFEDLTIYSFMTDITILTVAIIAEKLNIPKYTRNTKEIAFYVMNALYGDEYAEQRAAIILEVFEILTMIGMVDKDEIIAALAEMK